jgi:hypothetical protein
MSDQVDSPNQVEEKLEKECEKQSEQKQSEQKQRVSQDGRIQGSKIQVVKLYVATIIVPDVDRDSDMYNIAVAGHSIKHARALLRLIDDEDLPFCRLSAVIAYKDMSLESVKGSYDDFVENSWLEPKPSRVSIELANDDKQWY